MSKKLIKKILYTALLAVFLFQGLQAIEVTPPSGPYYINDTINFRPTSSAFGNAYQADWNFGDGSTTTVTSGMDTVSHSYNSPGTYTVTVQGQFSNMTPITESVTITVISGVQNRYIMVEPGQPYAGQEATFTAYNFATPDSIRWDMGDGTILRTGGNARGRRLPGFKNRRGPISHIAGGSVVTHTYSSPGTYTVRAYDYSGDDNSPTTLRVTVRMPSRSITWSPATPLAGAPVQFNAVNFLSTQINWNFGDGTVVNGGGISTSHVYANSGTYTVSAVETSSNYNPVTVQVTVNQPNRQILYQPMSPRVDQMIQFQALNFLTNTVDWNFGDGTLVQGGNTRTHRYQTAGAYTVSAKDSSINHTPVSITVTILPENRYITVSPPEVRTNETVTVQAFNFRDTYVLWDFGDGTSETGFQTQTHIYTRAGVYTITARDESGESQVPFTAQVTVQGIDDQVNLEVAEILLDNGKYYKVVSKNSKDLAAVLRMKMRGTGTIAGHWLVDGRPFEFFNQVVSQGMLKEIRTRDIPGIPTIEPGLHTISVRLTQPGDLPVQFPVLKYYVLPYENTITPLTPVDGFVAKENEVPTFSWEAARRASRYQVAFSNHLYPIMNNTRDLKWVTVGTALTFTPGKALWAGIERNRWTYWKVRAVDTFGELVAESDIMDIKVVIATADLRIDKVTDLEGNELQLSKGSLRTGAGDVLIHGSIQYKGDSRFLVLRVYAENELCDQLLFRDVKKGETRRFETAVPHKHKLTRVFFRVLKTSSPAVIVGLKNLVLKR